MSIDCVVVVVVGVDHRHLRRLHPDHAVDRGPVRVTEPPVGVKDLDLQEGASNIVWRSVGHLLRLNVHLECLHTRRDE